ncbi:hypothetical protein VNI00_019272 [Paramarasmius palmivorus]|uniref:Aminotransferase class I/classII large domain-containing protein n=1 Tax=Paramarasmius palmivorus TaxID=297713 RepID=A0AAW0AQN0_9AGAR
MSTPNFLNIALEDKLSSRAKRNVLLSVPQPIVASASYTYFVSNDFLSLSKSSSLRSRLLEALNRTPDILGAGGSRLLVNTTIHDRLETRLASFFGHDHGGALLFNSGYDANVSLFSTIPQPGDVVVYDEYIHASVHDGLRSGCRAEKQVVFAHNSLPAMRYALQSILDEKSENYSFSDTVAFRLKTGKSSLFLAVESLYSMEGSVAPLRQMIEVLEELFPLGNAYMIVDEAHATGVYGPQGRGRVALEGLEGHPRIIARLATFGKALAAAGAVVLTTPLLAKYLANYARPLIYTTTLSQLSVIAASCSFDMLEDGTADRKALHVLDTSRWLVRTLVERMKNARLGSESLVVGALPSAEDAELSAYSPIVPLITPLPLPPMLRTASPAILYDTSPAVDLSVHLRSRHGIVAHSISFPTVPKGKERVRICLNANHTREEVSRLVEGVLEWVRAFDEARIRSVKVGTEHFEFRSRL